MQKLILPINAAKLTASIDTTVYTNRFGFPHYGADFVSTNGKTYLCGLGNGKVAFTGKDSVCGNVMGVIYKDVFNHYTGQHHDLVIRYFHLAKISVQKNDAVTMDTLLGFYGNTGKYSTSAHLHVEADLDTLYPQYSPTITKGSILRGTAQGATPFTSPKNTVVNSIEYFYRKVSSPENQTYSTAKDAFIRISDNVLPLYGKEV